MKPLYSGIAVAILQCLLVLTVAGKYALDRQNLPRAWARAAPYDPGLPVRGRYVSLILEVEDVPDTTTDWGGVTLHARGGRLVAEGAPTHSELRVTHWHTDHWRLAEPLPFFISEHVPDPSIRKQGEELWVEVSVPAKGEPRPIRLAVKKDGVLTPLDLR